MNQLQKAAVYAALITAVLMLAGCNTMAGLGRDITGASEGTAKKWAEEVDR